MLFKEMVVKIMFMLLLELRVYILLSLCRLYIDLSSGLLVYPHACGVCVYISLCKTAIAKHGALLCVVADFSGGSRSHMGQVSLEDHRAALRVSAKLS